MMDVDVTVLAFAQWVSRHSSEWILSASYISQKVWFQSCHLTANLNIAFSIITFWW